LPSDTIQAQVKNQVHNPFYTKFTSAKLSSGISDFLGLNSSNSNDKPVLYHFLIPFLTSSVDRFKSRVLALQIDPNTYLTDPTDSNEFLAWKESFQINTQTDAISALLATDDKIREIHTKLGISHIFSESRKHFSSNFGLLQRILGTLLFQDE
jgi:hypothetical protein